MSFWTVSLFHCDHNDWRTYPRPLILLKLGLVLSFIQFFFIKETLMSLSCFSLREELGMSLSLVFTLFSFIVLISLWCMFPSLSQSDWKAHWRHGVRLNASSFLCWAPCLCCIWSLWALRISNQRVSCLRIFELEKSFQWAVISSHDNSFSHR